MHVLHFPSFLHFISHLSLFVCLSTLLLSFFPSLLPSVCVCAWPCMWVLEHVCKWTNMSKSVLHKKFTWLLITCQVNTRLLLLWVKVILLAKNLYIIRRNYILVLSPTEYVLKQLGWNLVETFRFIGGNIYLDLQAWNIGPILLLIMETIHIFSITRQIVPLVQRHTEVQSFTCDATTHIWDLALMDSFWHLLFHFPNVNLFPLFLAYTGICKAFVNLVLASYCLASCQWSFAEASCII